jgi:hypothetical protein
MHDLEKKKERFLTQQEGDSIRSHSTTILVYPSTTETARIVIVARVMCVGIAREWYNCPKLSG